uniref:Uncharacterized protein n=1 Tax=Anguilla anguilla TaxID=7936 RepID=A0A0E9U2H6_ANGAN
MRDPADCMPSITQKTGAAILLTHKIKIVSSTISATIRLLTQAMEILKNFLINQSSMLTKVSQYQ